MSPLTFAQTNKKFREHIATLTEEELNAYAEENKHEWATWQLTCVNVERGWRQGITSVEQAARIAREKDHCIITMKQKNGMFVYMNDDGRIYYETPVTVH
jgi:hypothetical protein